MINLNKWINKLVINTSKTRVKLLMTAYSPLRIASSEFGKLSATLEPESKTLPIEFVLGMPILCEHTT